MSGILIASEFSGLSLPGMLPSDLVMSSSAGQNPVLTTIEKDGNDTCIEDGLA